MATSTKPLARLRERLESGRRSKQSIDSYEKVGKQFLAWLGKKTPGTTDFRKYFAHRREEGISEATLNKEYHYLRLFADEMEWEWKTHKDEVPHRQESPVTKVMPQSSVEKMILSQHLLTRFQRFYLAVATTYGSRAEELAKIEKRHYDSDHITLFIAKQKYGRTKKVKHMIPAVLKPIFADCRPRQHLAISMAPVFKSICKRAGVECPKGYNWHSLRKRHETMIQDSWPVPENTNFEDRKEIARAIREWGIMVSHYLGWSQKKTGQEFFGSDMGAYYYNPEKLQNDPYYADKLIHGAHPWLKLWAKALKAHPIEGKDDEVEDEDG